MAIRVFPMLLLACFVFMLAAPARATSLNNELRIHLRRASFDPLQDVSTRSRAQTATEHTRLRLVQFVKPVDAASEAVLREAGMEPLAYIPDQTLLVRATSDQIRMPAGVRWSGLFLPVYKYGPELDHALAAHEMLALVLLGTPDAQAERLESAVREHGGQVSEQQQSAFGPKLLVTMPGEEARQLLARDDVLWVEQQAVAQALNDQAQRIMRVDAARAQFPGLTGRGQRIAIADTGLDIQEKVVANENPDFPAERVVQARNLCDGQATWTDRQGHGTHVAGIALGGGGFAANKQFAGVAPEAELVVQSLAVEERDGLCLDANQVLADAYAADAKIVNASLGYATVIGVYDVTAAEIDAFVWEHPDLLFVVAAGNSGADCEPRLGNACSPDGVIDEGSINAPGPAKNALTVGATESMRPERGGLWGTSIATIDPIANDPRSDDPNGMAAFSSRGPSSDGRIKPEIVAPGVNIVSSVSHADGSRYGGGYYAGMGLNYAYESGTSMAAPMISGAAALVRQWLAEQRGMTAPSAALVKALLLNGATNIAPGQYGSGAAREIPAAWPNNVIGWGRADLAATIGVGQTPLLFDDNQGLEINQQLNQTLELGVGQTMRATLVWSDRAALPNAATALVNNLDLELTDESGMVVARGNQQAALPGFCRSDGFDRCNNAETIDYTALERGSYMLRVRAAFVLKDAQAATQPFAVVVALPKRVFLPLLGREGL